MHRQGRRDTSVGANSGPLARNDGTLELGHLRDDEGQGWKQGAEEISRGESKRSGLGVLVR